MSVGRRNVIALVLQRMTGRIFDLPPRPSTPPAVRAVPWAHAPVRHPAKVLDLVRANRPILEAMDPPVWGRGLPRPSMHKAAGMESPYGTVVSLIRGHTAGVLSSR